MGGRPCSAGLAVVLLGFLLRETVAEDDIRTSQRLLQRIKPESRSRLKTFLRPSDSSTARKTESHGQSGRPQSFITNGVESVTDRYPYFVSLRYKLNTSRNRTASPKPFCGATLISERLILTAAHCAMADDFITYYAAAKPTAYRALGLAANITSFPNTYILSTSLEMYAFIGAQSRGDSGTGNQIQMWFAHPWYDPDNLYYDIAVGVLTTPVTNVTPVKIFNAPGDIYNTLSNTTNITAVGLGDLVSDDYSELVSSINATYVDPNNSTDSSRPLREAVIGTLVGRGVCGRYITASAQKNSSDMGGNTRFGTTATVISPGQMCVGPASNEEITNEMLQTANAIVSSVDSIATSTLADLRSRDINYTSVNEIYDLVDGYNDTCQGDSGGPIIVKASIGKGFSLLGETASEDVQLGTVSYGVGCGSGIAGVYNTMQAFLNLNTWDDFLLRVLQAVPNLDASSSSMSSLVTSIPNTTTAG